MTMPPYRPENPSCEVLPSRKDCILRWVAYLYCLADHGRNQCSKGNEKCEGLHIESYLLQENEDYCAQSSTLALYLFGNSLSEGVIIRSNVNSAPQFQLNVATEENSGISGINTGTEDEPLPLLNDE